VIDDNIFDIKSGNFCTHNMLILLFLPLLAKKLQKQSAKKINTRACLRAYRNLAQYFNVLFAISGA
jgi:hypothetical protein